MQNLVEYSFDIPSDTPKTLKGLEGFIKSISHVFEAAIMGKFAGNREYTYIADNLEVTEINIDPSTCEGSFSFSVDVDFFKGCSGMDALLSEDLTVEFTIQNGMLLFVLDETLWEAN